MSTSPSTTTLRVEKRDVLTVLCLVAVAQCCYAWLGVRFDSSTFPGYMQFIDLVLLRDHLLESLWYYHAHPPLLNLLAGVGVKVFGEHAHRFFDVCFLSFGTATVYAVYCLAMQISSSRWVGVSAATLLAFNPAFILYENWFMYTLPSAALLTCAAFALYRYTHGWSTPWCLGFFWLLAALLLTRSLFHIGWLLLITLLLAGLLRAQRRQVLLCAALPLAVVAFWYGKNFYYFGLFGSSSLMGIGLSNVTTLTVPREQLAPLVEAGKLSPFALISRHDQRETLFTWQELPSTGIAVLDQIEKSTGEYNYNNRQMLSVNRHYTRDALVVIREFPASYVIGLILANRVYFSPASTNIYFAAENREAVRPIERWYNLLLYGASPVPGLIRQPHFGFARSFKMAVNTGSTLLVLWVGSIAYAYARARSALLIGNFASSPGAIVFGFVLVTAVYLYAVSTGLELSENNRYRFLVEPLITVVGAVGLHAFISKLPAALQNLTRRRQSGGA